MQLPEVVVVEAVQMAAAVEGSRHAAVMEKGNFVELTEQSGMRCSFQVLLW